MIKSPIADRIRPQTLDDVVGQEHLLQKEKPLRRIIQSGHIPNMIFYGPSGTGKTTVARIIAQNSGMTLYKLNGTSASSADIKEIIAQTQTFSGCDGILLYLDEIQYLNKKQQQILLEYLENGEITMIASTTENPYFAIFNALISRCAVFEFKPVSACDVQKAVKRAFDILSKENGFGITVQDGVIEHISGSCAGDVRKAVSAAELCTLSGDISKDGVYISLETAKSLALRSSMRYDRDSDEHYDIISAFQKSIRGSDENAALHYLARLIEASDILSVCRRLLVIASEDIGLAYPMAVTVVKSCVDSALQLGLPEARIPLAQAVILLCTSPKSNSVITAIDEALQDVKNGNYGEIPAHLKDGHYKGAKSLGRSCGYLYPHDYKNSYVPQRYLPEELKDRKYYRFGSNKQEQAALEYRKKITDR